MPNQQNYERWKKEYALRQKSERKKYLLKLSLIPVIFFAFYYWYIGELKFILQPTEYTKGVVISTGSWNTSPQPGLGIGIQYGIYEYHIDGHRYEQKFFPTKSIGRLTTGDSLEIKYSKFFPSINKVYRITFHSE